MQATFQLFGYSYEKVEDTYELAFRGTTQFSFTLSYSDSSLIRWSYGYSPMYEMHMNNDLEKIVDFCANYNIITHNLRGVTSLDYETWESHEQDINNE